MNKFKNTKYYRRFIEIQTLSLILVIHHRQFKVQKTPIRRQKPRKYMVMIFKN